MFQKQAHVLALESGDYEVKTLNPPADESSDGTWATTTCRAGEVGTVFKNYFGNEDF